MADIEVCNIQMFFNLIGKPYRLTHFELPESKYENGNISFFETVVICLFCANNKPKTVLEFGTFNGRTTINIAANIPPKAEIITVDLPKKDLRNTRYALEGINEDDENDELGYVGKTIKVYQKHPLALKGKIKQFWMDTADFPVQDYNNHFDFIFVDASHTYDNCRNDSLNALKCVKEDGFILWHDYAGWPGVTQALDEIYGVSDHKEHWIHIEGTSMVMYYANRN